MSIEVSTLPLVFRRKDALAWGLHERVITRLVRSGEWVRLRHGAYTTREVWESADVTQRHALIARAALLQSKSEAVASHVSAAALMGCPSWGLDLSTVHLTRFDRRAGRAEAGVRQHCGQLAAADVVDIGGGVHATGAARTAIDLTTILSVEASLVQVNHLLHEGAVSLEELRARAIASERHRGTLATDLTLRLAEPGAESVLESRGLFCFWRLGVPRPIVQHEVRDDLEALVARLDAALPDHGAWFEFDGRGKYAMLRSGETIHDLVLREKAREDAVREITGMRCMRITWQDLARPRPLRARIERFLGVDLSKRRAW